MLISLSVGRLGLGVVVDGDDVGGGGEGGGFGWQLSSEPNMQSGELRQLSRSLVKVSIP